MIDAVDCAVEIQTEIAARNAAIADPDRRMQFRIGVNLGDVIVEGDGIYGDGVNIAARLESLADYGGIALSVNAYEQVRDKLPYRFVDRGEQRVKNIARPVRVYAVDMSASGVAPRREPLPRRACSGRRRRGAVVAALLAFPRLGKGPPAQAASIAVLPFANHSADTKREFFSDGLTEDVINARALLGHPRHRAQHGAGVQVPHRRPDQISRELGVRYVVMGSVRQADGRLRVGVELSDAMKGTLLWSERYDGEGKRGVRDPGPHRARHRRLARRQAQRARAAARGGEAAGNPGGVRARAAGPRADARGAAPGEPRSAHPHRAGDQARAELRRGARGPGVRRAAARLFGWMEDPSDGLRRAEQAARRALAIDDAGANARAHAILGNIHTFTGNYEAALVDADRAIELNPSDAIARSLRGGILLWTGKIEESIAASEAARRYDPRLPAEGMFNLALAYYLAGRYREAAQAALAVEPNARTCSRAVHAAALAQLGDAEAAARSRGGAPPRPVLRRQAFRPAPGEPGAPREGAGRPAQGRPCSSLVLASSAATWRALKGPARTSRAPACWRTRRACRRRSSIPSGSASAFMPSAIPVAHSPLYCGV